MKTIHESSNANIDAVRHKSQREITRTADVARRQANEQRKPCGNCGFSHRPRSCPAYGKQCDNCSRIGHFAKCCRSTQRARGNDKRVYDVRQEQSEWSENDSDQGIDHITIHSVDGQDNKNSEQYATINVRNKKLRIKLDTGAETSVLTQEDYNKLVPRKQRNSKLHPSRARLTAYGGHAIPVIGQCNLMVQTKNTKKIVKFQVVEKGKSLLGCEDSKDLLLVSSRREKYLKLYERNLKTNLMRWKNQALYLKSTSLHRG